MAETPPEVGLLTDLDSLLEGRRGELTKLDRYYDGKHKLAFATSKFRATFGNLFREFADNWCDLVVDAAAERLEVQGFRFAKNEDADDKAWELWKRSHMDADSDTLHTEAIKLGEASVIVNPPTADNEGFSRLTVEHPSQVFVRTANGDRRKRTAAIKKWLDESGRLYATLYTPREVFKFQSKDEVAHLTASFSSDFSWEPREGVVYRARHGFDVVPVIPFRNNPTLLTGGRSDMAKAISIQDAINKLVTDMIVASEYAAFRQRWATGIEMPEDEDEEKFLSAVSRVWTVEDPDTKFGEFGVTELKNYVDAIEMLIQHLAAQTRTPPHYLLGQSGAFPSGESLKATETGLVARVKDKWLDFGQAHTEAMRLAFGAMGDEEKAKAWEAEVIWTDPESRTEGETADAALKLKDLGVPEEALWERIGATPNQIERWRKLREEEQARQEALAFVGTNPGDQGLPGDPGTPSGPLSPDPGTPAPVPVRGGTAAPGTPGGGPRGR